VLALPHRWIWDFWLADDGGRFHLFFLQAPRALGDPDLRHWNVSIGHAVSDDLRDWEVLGDALAPSADPGFDDMTTWTGCTVRGDDGGWCMFYTGSSARERGLKQRVCLATSTDLMRWERRGVVLESDPRWYEQLGSSDWKDEAWRDPWVLRDPGGDGWHMLLTARAATGPSDRRGVIAHARSSDLVTWEAGPPLSAPDRFGHLEVPQVATVDGRHVLLFSCLATELSGDDRRAGVGGGVWSVPVEDPLGPYDIARATPLTDETLYSGRIVCDRAGDPMLLAFRNVDAAGRFVGEITEPMPVAWRPSGLQVNLPRAASPSGSASRPLTPAPRPT
jgi:beta-fructofuranosidase